MSDFALSDNPQVRLMGTDSLLVRRLYWYGENGYEGQELQWWRHFCARSKRIVEMGANVGFYTVQAAVAAPTAKIVAVEAHPVSAEVTRQNLALNGIESVTVVEAAVVGDATLKSVRLLLPDGEQYEAPTGAFVTGAEVADRPAGTHVDVPAVFAPELVRGADLLKLDIEGLEADVLEACAAAVAEARPVIFVEVIRSAFRLRALIADWHERLGYVVFAIGTDSLHLVTKAQLSSKELLPRFGTRDVILVPQEKTATI